uniref:Uncharacterized protein n=1 Tax=Arion vulgaris TaxID=1028688 RepID=A0A0B6Z4W0_9EUPU
MGLRCSCKWERCVSTQLKFKGLEQKIVQIRKQHRERLARRFMKWINQAMKRKAATISTLKEKY